MLGDCWGKVVGGSGRIINFLETFAWSWVRVDQSCLKDGVVPLGVDAELLEDVRDVHGGIAAMTNPSVLCAGTCLFDDIFWNCIVATFFSNL